MGEYFQSFDPSPLAREFLAHLKALEPLESISVGKSLSIPKERFRLPVFVHIAEHWYKEHPQRISYIVVEHEESFEVCRIPDGLNPASFYGTLDFLKDESKQKIFSDARNVAITNACRVFIQSRWKVVQNYCVGMPELMQQERIIPYSYFQRKLAATSPFRKSTKGSTASLHEALDLAVESGILRKLDKGEVHLRYQCNAACFEYLLPIPPLPRL